ncbi:hypothetical protein GSI_06551 [Ganoderma sinense ZZ0214-1]|uniref:RNase III domain-containing protein n=1 Tax=Ganoderma sinense ZZ0214-1 TaxID=1077348 RepID=A0A2G8SDP8_9APHY|nr:hypothetical protein GSI_06551 [Ganoderma sinense ZZ0214-1]
MAPTQLLQHAINEAADHPTYTAGLPPLSEKRWVEILNNSDYTAKENDRLEFVGDALMYAALARQMYKQYPDGNPHFYTCLRGALNSNATFSRISEKMEFYCVSGMVLQGLTRRTFGEGTLAPLKSKGQVKLTADLFETIVAAYYWDSGFEALARWVGETYRPLIKAAADEYDNYRRQNGHFRAKYLPTKPGHAPGRLSFTSPTPGNGTLSDSTRRPSNQVIAIKHQLRTVEKIKARSSRSPPLKRAVLGGPNVVPKVGAAATKTHVKPLVTASVTKAVQVASSAPKTVVFIDLTQESDSEGRGAASPGLQSRAMPSLPRRKVLVSKQPATSARARVRVGHLAPPSTVASSGFTVAGARPGGHRSSSSESEDEVLLETMLVADTSDSDMDCSSSDVESPIRPPGYLQLLGPTCVDGHRADGLPRWRSYNKDPIW